MTPLGVIFLAIFAVSLFAGRKGFLYALALSISFNDSVVIAAGNVVVTPFYVGLMVYAALWLAVWRKDAQSASLGLGGQLPLALLAYGVLITAISPGVFAGIGVVSASIGLDAQANALTPLAYSLSNLAQIAYLALTVFLVISNERSGAFTSKHVSVGLGFGVLVACTGLIGPSWPHTFFDNSPKGFYSIETGRLRAQFAEPSHLGAFATAAALYFVVMLVMSTTVRQFFVRAIFSGLSVVLLVASSSGTGSIGILLAVILICFIGLVRRRSSGPIRIPISVFLFGLAAAVAAAALLPKLISILSSIIASKTDSLSLSTRSFVDTNSIDVLLRTFLLGAGDGSNRGSSLLLMILSQLGIVGTILFLAIAARAVFRGIRVPANLPASMALVGFLSAAFVSLADFVSPILWSLIAVCVFVNSHSKARPEFDTVGGGLLDTHELAPMR